MFYRLTTVDNPFDPFDEFDEWLSYDQTFGHNSAQVLARVLQSSSELPEEYQNKDIKYAIDSIIENDVENKFRKVTRDNIRSIM